VGPVTSALQPALEPAPSTGEVAPAPAEESAGAEATIPEPVRPPVVEEVRPPVETGERRRPDLTRNPVQVRPAPPPRVAATPPRPQNRPAQPARPPAAQPNRGPSFADVVGRIGRPPSPSRDTAPAAPASPAPLSGAQRQRISSQIGGLIQPCATRAQPPNAFARSISVVIQVTVTPSGTPTGHRLVSSSGVDGNEEYVDDVVGVAMRAVRACAARIATLPSEYYQNGWRTFQYRFRFP
jgi:hypothetical protein